MKAWLLGLIMLLITMPVGAQSSPPRGLDRPITPADVGQSKAQSNRPDPVNIRLTFYLIQADGFTNDDADIKPIVVELRKIFKFSGYRLASKSVLASATDASGRANAQQMVSDPDGNLYRIYAESIAAADGTIKLSVSLNEGNTSRSYIDASVNIKDSKTVVLGSAMGGKDKAIILAVTPSIDR